MADNEAIYNLLAPATQDRLARLLHLAHAQAGGPRRLKAKDLLVAGMYRLPMATPLLLGQVKESGDRATVDLLHRKKLAHRLHLTRTKQGHWRVVLPDSVLQPPRPDAPGSQPASRPGAAAAPSPQPASRPGAGAAPGQQTTPN